jgi:phosphatidylglycerophosphate synthase
MDQPKQIRRTAEIEEFTNRALIHPISGWLVPVFHRLDVHPNTVSLGGALCGVLAAGCYYFYDLPAATLGGFLLMVGWHILDGADGQLARLSGKVTASGYVIDGICDYTTFVFVYVALSLRLTETDGPGIWVLSVAAGASHIVQAAAFELQRAAYQAWVGGKAFAAASPAAGKASPVAILRGLAAFNDWVQRPFHPVSPDLAVRLRAYGTRSDTARAEIAEAYRAGFRTAVLRWSSLSANNRTIAIFLACLVGIPHLYFAFEIAVLNFALILLVRMNRHRAAGLSSWLSSRGG